MNSQVVCDLHLHSKYSRAVSQQMVLPEMDKWANLKGIDILGTGDFTHPLWISEIESLLEEEEGLYRLKNNISKTRFLLTSEISSIYTQGGKCRRIHNLVLSPSFTAAKKINRELNKRGCNLASDGRPIIGINSRDLTEIILSIDKDNMVIPCHVWTPWFSLYGSQSGFDSIDECYGDMSQYIYAVETGLSSSPEMNWRIKELANRSIISNSDAHSGAKLGREATVLKNIGNKQEITYKDIMKALKQDSESNWQISHTIEFYPEEGKYHFSGHRNCLIKQSPEETKKSGMICPKCRKNLTIGVMHRVEQLAGYPEMKPTYIETVTNEGKVKMITSPKKTKTPYVMLVPLMEIISEALKIPTTSIKIATEYRRLIELLGSEFRILLNCSIEEIKKVGGERIAEGILKVREGNITVDPGYDGVFGEVKIWNEEKENNKEKDTKDSYLLMQEKEISKKEEQLDLVFNNQNKN